MYNGIGLATPRGSGTNGYVVKNLSTVARRPRPETYTAEVQDQSDLLPYRKPDEGILLHEKKRQIEVQCLELQIKLEDQGLVDDDITIQVDNLRSRLQLALEAGKEDKPIKFLKPHDTHQLAEAKKYENSKMMRALGISEQKYIEGAAFDRDRIQQEKMRKATKIELENARKLQQERLMQDTESDSSSESEAEKRRRKKVSKKSRKSKRKEKKVFQESLPANRASHEAAPSQARPFVHPSRQHLQPNMEEEDSKEARHSHRDFNSKLSHQHSLSPSTQIHESHSSTKVNYKLEYQGRAIRRSVSRSPRHVSSQRPVTRRSVSRSPRQVSSQAHVSRYSISRSPRRDSSQRRAIRRSVSRSPRQVSSQVHVSRRSVSRSPRRDSSQRPVTRRSVSRSPRRVSSHGRISRRSVSRSPRRVSSHGRISRRSVSRSPRRVNSQMRVSRGSIPRSPYRSGSQRHLSRRSVSCSSYSSSGSRSSSYSRSSSKSSSSASQSSNSQTRERHP